MRKAKRLPYDKSFRHAFKGKGTGLRNKRERTFDDMARELLDRKEPAEYANDNITKPYKG